MVAGTRDSVDGVRRPADRGRLQPAGRGASLPACPLRPASCPEDCEALRNWKRVLQDRALVRAKVAGVPDRPGLTWLLEQASLEQNLLGIQSALGLLVHTEAWPPGACHHWSRAVKLDKKVTTEGSWIDSEERDNSDPCPLSRPSKGPRARRASLEAPCRDPLRGPAGKAGLLVLSKLEIPHDSHESAWTSVRKTVSTAPHSQAAVSTRPARTSTTTSPGWRLASSSVAARRTNPSRAPVCQSPGIASTEHSTEKNRRRTPSHPA